MHYSIGHMKTRTAKAMPKIVPSEGENLNKEGWLVGQVVEP